MTNLYISIIPHLYFWFHHLCPGQCANWIFFNPFPFHIFFSPPLNVPSLPLSLPLHPFSCSLFLPFLLFSYPYTVISAMFPFCLSATLPHFSSLPSVPLLQIQYDSHSLPGLNHQDLLQGPNRGSVSPQRGFCLLTVETNDLHALCLWSVPRHLEAVEVITVICLTRRATAHSHSPPLHLLPTVKAALF